ncbi:MAG: anaerobic ribonucleoside-triphosphate reductase activating protein [Candidatus Korarchaeota archaeon]|nr:anaerobic ribonucleoside-triphosphate reductase activating protein [Candidatus Korarchaeota archaeon]NIU83055.1 anaerobic ribonucleoside-triphosphate reductase activating protein [Candidatus Thorarchaeota archaeon]NIW12599.1 anaerobic ribonucleoside-triphosphate reductase activating protein [Candidatus Thorarchaeota archaeon]NIW50810.1 anaerobic ribonucleoside-triphosphate reductase activating protein [Candidatus Korarchaeota archaeon]
MELVGFQPLSLIDYPEKLSCIVWTLGCNFRCPFCYNADIVFGREENLHHVDEDEFFSFLEKRKRFLDGVVITGGEPTLQSGLPEFIEKIKKRGFLAKLDTNGTHPEVLKALLRRALIDYIAMDIKAPLKRYEELVNARVDQEQILESISLIKQAPKYEFRTTVIPNLIDVEDIEKISKLVGKGKYVLQQFEPKSTTIDPSYTDKEPYSEQVLEEMCNIAKKHVQNCKIRGI